MLNGNTAGFPTTVWDGTSPVRPDASVYRGPDTEDWQQITVELIATQQDINKLKYLSAPNASGGTLANPGVPVYLKADGSGFALADANGTAPLPYCVGLLTGSTASLATGTIQKSGDLVLTTAQWDTAAGTTGGLVANKEYFLSGTAGVITSTAPATTGDHDLSIGVARDSVTLAINLCYRRVSP